MKDFKSGFNPFSPENLTTFLTISVIMGALIVLVILSDKFIIPRLNPDSKLLKWWEKHMVTEDPFEK